MLIANNVTWTVAGAAILQGASLSVVKGETLGLVGPNGSGKSSLIRLLAGIRKCTSGDVEIDGAALSKMCPNEIAEWIALVEQQAETTDFIKVKDVVALGRTPYLGAFNPWSKKDDLIVREALMHVDMSELSERTWHTLSGGERQRAHIARALAQKPRILLLDEPTNHLDIRHQIDILSLVRELPITSVLVLHDLNLAAIFCDRVAVMSKGRIVAIGGINAVLTSELISEVFGINVNIQKNKEDGSWNLQFQAPSKFLSNQRQSSGLPTKREGSKNHFPIAS